MALLGLQGNVPTRGPGIASLYWSMSIIAAICVGIRVISLMRKHRSWRGLWWDDYLLLLAAIAFLIVAMLVNREVQFGYGRHTKDVVLAYFGRIGLLMTISNSLVCYITACSKGAVALMVWTVARDITWLKWSLSITIIISFLVFTAAASQPWMRCSPTAKHWNPAIPGECYSLNTYLVTTAIAYAYGAFVDLVLAASPWAIMPYLRVTWREKIGVGIATALGVVASASSATKAALLYTAMDRDFSWDAIEINIATTLEIFIVVVLGCAPAVRLFFRDSRRSSHRRSMAGNGNRAPEGDDRRGRARSTTTMSQPSSMVVGMPEEPRASFLFEGHYTKSGSDDRLVKKDSSLNHFDKKDQV
ncbi:hypothetical protein MKZ38_008595 [Zalerion maritima]|uniref:Rhodopsin domain-containing protein n=1 Tax=Zalerion maritima TaxID=339359 RepID=A0AAD5WYI2_9PEZI|nr:hypothetical protein MKZ38_008595 [Zalerion maritima]